MMPLYRVSIDGCGLSDGPWSITVDGFTTPPFVAYPGCTDTTILAWFAHALPQRFDPLVVRGHTLELRGRNVRVHAPNDADVTVTQVEGEMAR